MTILCKLRVSWAFSLHSVSVWVYLRVPGCTPEIVPGLWAVLLQGSVGGCMAIWEFPKLRGPHLEHLL